LRKLYLILGGAVVLVAAVLYLLWYIYQSREKPLIWAADAEGGVPYIFKNPANPDEYIGFEVELAHALAREMGREIQFQQYNYDSLIPGLLRKDFDLAMNGLEITPARKKKAHFCRPYYIYKLQLVVRDDETRFTTLEECKEKDVVIATLGATAAEDLLKEWGIETRIYDDQEGPYKDLQNKRVDGVLFDLPIASFYAKQDATNPYAKRMKGLKFTGEPLEKGYYGIAVRHDDERLAKDIDDALNKLIANGELKSIYEKWDIWNPTQDELPQASTADVEDEPTVVWTFGKYFPMLVEGAIVTVIITVASMALAVFVGLFVSLARMYGGPILSGLATGYIEFFRGIPVLLLLYFLYFGLPSISAYYELPFSLNLDPWTAAILGLGLNYAAYEAEIYRSAISAIPRGQWEAAASLGMSGPMTFRRIILPQAVRGILPPMTNDFVALFKDTSLVSVIAVVELNKQYQILTKSGGDFLEIGGVTAVLYLIMSVPLGYLSRYLEKRWGVQG
jgi:polar amino acid transport system substrate-binding protein